MINRLQKLRAAMMHFRFFPRCQAFALAVVVTGWSLPSVGAEIPLYGLFETSVINTASYSNPFSETELQALFISPTGKKFPFRGFYDGDQTWRQRFMPDEQGTWTYTLKFSDGQAGTSGSFQCITEGAKPGPWRPNADNPHWLKTADGDHFLPVAMFADCAFSPTDWKDAVGWCKAKGFNTLVTRTLNHDTWGDGWKNVTCFATAEAATKSVNYDLLNLEMWREWDSMIQHAGENGIYVGPFDGLSGKYGGQWRGKYPPSALVMNPARRDRFDTPGNLRLIRYLVARQGAFWNLAYWSLGSTEVYTYAVADEAEFIEYGEYVASITPWDRMITGQDAEQWHDQNRRWLSKLSIPASRKLNAVQTGIGNPNKPSWGKSNPADPAFQNARPNNELALDSYNGFPILTTEGLWEGQGRAKKPLRIIWGFLTAGAHTMWADWSYERPETHDFGSIGRGWVPVKPLKEHLFKTNQLGVDCQGDEQLVLALAHLRTFDYWKMSPHNDLVDSSDEAYCLAEPGKQYLVYAPGGGNVTLELKPVAGTLAARWFNPRDGTLQDEIHLRGGASRTLTAPSPEDWVLSVTKLVPDGGSR